MRLADAVASAPRARMLATDNTASAPVPLDEAVASGRAYLVTPRAGLLVVDLDLPADPTRSADRVASLETLLHGAATHGVPHLRVPSGRPGHAHAYLAVGSGPERARLERWCTERGLDVRTRGIRPPGSPHRSGRGRAWHPEDTVEDVLAALTAAPSAEASAALASALCPLVLPGRVRTAVRHGHGAAGYDSPSHARMALAVGVRAHGGTPALVTAILRDATSPLGATFRAKPTDWQHVEIARVWAKAGAWIEAGGRPDPRDHLVQVAAAAAGWAWKGTAGGSDLAVLEELLRCATAVPTTTVGASLGKIAVGAGVSLDTARTALRRLGTAGWVRVVTQETPRTTRTYALLIPPGADTSGTGHVPDRDALGDLGADIARWRGLGKVSMRVARTIGRTPGASTAALAQALHMATATVRYHLRKLTRARLLRGDPTGWALTGTVRVALDALSRHLGVDGTRNRQSAAMAHNARVRAAARATFAARYRHAAARHADAAPPLPAST
ncbi:hypothetical protein SAMN04487781_3092 [Cellulosimicrobium cellulans]|nr:hypothetical protein SAMN04487781_3092 [Cellulosimicrobium cellulans]